MNTYVYTKNNNYNKNADPGQRNVFPVTQKRIYKNFETNRRTSRGFQQHTGTAHAKINSIITVFRGTLISEALPNVEWNALSLGNLTAVV
jgi:hypothetical protein